MINPNRVYKAKGTVVSVLIDTYLNCYDVIVDNNGIIYKGTTKKNNLRIGDQVTVIMGFHAFADFYYIKDTIKHKNKN